jgi:hypothetical protein
MIRHETLHLPRVDEPPPNLALMVLGKALAQAYLEPIDRPLPPALAKIVREIEEREALADRQAASDRGRSTLGGDGTLG